MRGELGVDYDAVVLFNGELWYTHGPIKCAGEVCMIHNPSDHHMREWPTYLRNVGPSERICIHGIGHPDPDSMKFFNRTAGDDPFNGAHGCDGCCRKPEPKGDHQQ